MYNYNRIVFTYHIDTRKLPILVFKMKVSLLPSAAKSSPDAGGATDRGFALISCIAIMSLLIILSIGMLSFATIETKQAEATIDDSKAQANARLALEMAISQLQHAAGSDLVVTARADLLSNERTISNKNWVGAWRTTYQQSGSDIDWPLIGQKTDSGNQVYAYKGTYSDLRQTIPLLSAGKWKDELLTEWLVSAPSKKFDPSEELDPTKEDVLEILGKGTLGKSIAEADYITDRVLVKKIEISNGAAIAWWTADNNQKASIKPHELSASENEITSSPGENPKFIKQGSAYPFEEFQTKALPQREKIISLGSSHLTQVDPLLTKASLGRFTHDLTYHSPGMFINTALGGFQRDITPLLFAKKSDKTVEFAAPNSRISDTPFSSEYPIIASKYHDVLAPTFSALRYWGLQRYNTGNTIDTTLASSASRIRSSMNWPHGQSDGATFESAKWASEMPKTHPIMTDSRWHYYFSINGNKIRTHIIPRVCLWNPYNTEMQINDMVVMMPNPYYVDPSNLTSNGDGNSKTAGHNFFVEESEVKRMKDALPDDAAIQAWIEKEARPLGLKYKMRYGLKKSTQGFTFPNRRYLAFTLRGTTLAPGECHVFSPSIASPSITSSGVNLGEYQADDISQNVLSSDVPQGEDHFYYDMPVSVMQVRVPTSTDWKSLSKTTENMLNLEMIDDYEPQKGNLAENFPFILKASNGVIPQLDSLLVSKNHPTLQLINNGCGGVAPSSYFDYRGLNWGSANTISVGSFGSLQAFQDAPLKDAPGTHQVGAKLVWLDESTTEGNRAPLRYGTSSETRWSKDHMVYHPGTISNWNLRAQLTSRSPIAQCGNKYYLFSTGPWILQFIPKTPQDANDSPQLNSSGTAFIKNPLGLAINHSSSPNVVLFDLPHREHGIHSLAAMRHAMLSPYSWHPSYIIGHSLRDPHAPAGSTTHPEIVRTIDSGGKNHWDYYIGGSGSGVSHGAYAAVVDSEDLLQIGGSAAIRNLDSTSLTARDDILPYDIAYEVNQSLWDSYFISSLPLNSITDKFSSTTPINQRNQLNTSHNVSTTSLEENLLQKADATDTGFWLNGYYYRKDNAFNLNSTSVPAWTAFLSGTLGIHRELKDGSTLNNGLAGFARCRKPAGVADSDKLDPQSTDAWKGLRSLTELEIDQLAIAIVDEVKLRGPFISVADFVNRRLTDRDDETSHMGALDAAIFKAELNKSFYSDTKYDTSIINRGTDSDSRDNNEELFRDEYLYTSGGEKKTSQAATKTWGLPSFLMQSDLLEPLAPALTTRGDTFTIRAYGESKRNGKVVARAYIEAIVERSPHYIQHQSIEDTTTNNLANIPTDGILNQDPLTGEISEGNLTEINKSLGRRYRIKSFRWLNKDEI